MKNLKLKYEAPEKEIDKLYGELLDNNSYDTIIGQKDGATRVYKPNGELLAVYLPKVLDLAKCHQAWTILRKFDMEATNRGVAVGKDSRMFPIKKDGTVSKSGKVKNKEGVTPISGIIGFYDRYPRIPYCRKTAFNLNEPDKFAKIMPWVQEIASYFKEHVPIRYNIQMDMIKKTHPDWVISKTPFTTITVNQNWQTAVHKDIGDLEEGFGVMAVLKAGEYTGGFTIYPRYRIGFDVKTGDVILWNVHEHHGNVPMTGKIGKYERVSCVFYYRSTMWKCGSAEEELNIAKNRKAGDPMYK